MPLSSKISATRRAESFQYLGSFWNQVFSQKDLLRVLVDLNFRTGVLESLTAAVANMAGQVEAARLVTYRSQQFKFDDVVETGMFSYDDPQMQPEYTDSTDTVLNYDRYRIRYFALPLQSVVPISIQSTAGLLTLGLDFFIQASNWIYFRKDPRLLFPNGTYNIVSGLEVEYRSYISFLTKTVAPGMDDLIVNWLKRSQTPGTLRLALAACGRLGVIRQGGTLLSATRTDFGDYVYTFETEKVRVNYSHTPLIQGKPYAAGTIIGDAIRVYQASDTPIAWWRQIDWRGGLVLDPLIPGVHNLPLPDAATVAYVAGSDSGSVNGSRAHVRLALTDDYASELYYWEKVSRTESAQGLYINNVLQLPDAPAAGTAENGTYAELIAGVTASNVLNRELGMPEEKPDFSLLPASVKVNALDAFFEILLGRTAFVITFDASKLERQSEVYAFLKRELPAGATNIIFAYLSGSPAEPVSWGQDVLVTESVNIRTLKTATVSDSVTLDDAIHEYVTITPLATA